MDFEKFTRQQWEEASSETSSYESDLIWDGIKRRTSRGAYRLRIIMGISIAAASCAAALAVGVFSFRAGRTDVMDRLQDICISAPTGCRSAVALPDGTNVWLNAGSKLSYSQSYGLSDRNVTLVGEGYFEVAEDSDKPFTVSSSSLSVTVHGTKFNVEDYGSDRMSRVSLLEGSVSLTAAGASDEVFLKPGEVALLDRASGEVTVSEANVANSKEWVNGYLFFDDETLGSIASQLEASYDVTINFSSEDLKDIRFYGNFVRHVQTIDEVLGILSGTDKFHYIKSDNTITIY